MFDKNMVQRIAYENDFHELVTAIEDDYASILRNYSSWMEKIKEEDIPVAKRIVPEWRVE